MKVLRSKRADNPPIKYLPGCRNQPGRQWHTWRRALPEGCAKDPRARRLPAYIYSKWCIRSETGMYQGV